MGHIASPFSCRNGFGVESFVYYVVGRDRSTRSIQPSPNNFNSRISVSGLIFIVILLIINHTGVMLENISIVQQDVAHFCDTLFDDRCKRDYENEVFLPSWLACLRT